MTCLNDQFVGTVKKLKRDICPSTSLEGLYLGYDTERHDQNSKKEYYMHFKGTDIRSGRRKKKYLDYET